MDVQMEDADTQSHQQLDNVKASQDGTPDDPELKLGLSPQLPPAHESKNLPPQDLNDPQIHKEGAQIELGDQKQIQTHHSEKENKPFAEAKEKDTIAKGDDDHQEHTNAAEDETETKTMDQTDFKSAVKEQSPRGNNKDAKDTLNSTVGGKSPSKVAEDDEEAKNHTHNGQLPFQLPVSEVPPKKKEDGHQGEIEEMFKEPTEEVHQSKTEGLVKKELENKSLLLAAVSHDKTVTKATKPEVGDSPLGNKRQPATPDFPLKYSSRRSAGHSGETIKNVFNDSKMSENDDGTPEQQATFIKELENFYRQRGMEFKPPKFYGQPLNCYKLWTSVIKLGGYDLVTGTKLWRQVGESFHPPKTCTTVSWTFRIFYEKSLLEYERYKVQNGEVELPAATLPEPSGVDNEGNGYQASGSGRARRDAAARAMQGWHAQRLFGYGEDKSPNNMQKRENKLKSIGSLKQKRPNEAELPVKAQKTETFKQLVTTVVDVGPPADWVKINVRETKDCFEVYALVPGLLREEVRVQSDPAGRLVITGQPEQADNPWGITAFKKVVNLPARIDPLQTSAVVSLHGRLFVRVPFEQSN